jgi:hypothetical protein
MPEDSNDNIMMIGPTQAGKTSLLSVLRLASARKVNGKRVRIRPVNDHAKELFGRALDIVETGAIRHGANVSSTRYVFELTCDIKKRVRVEHFEEVPHRFWGQPTRVDRSYFEMVDEPRTFTLNVLDGKGGDVFGGRGDLEDEGEYRRRRAELVEMAGQSSALVICVNASDPTSTKHFFRNLQGFLDDVHSGGVRTPFARVAIALTQADRKVEQCGSSAQKTLEELDPADEATRTLGVHAKAGLFQALGEAAQRNVYAGWVSVYGFIPDEGSVNFDSVNGRIAIFRPDDAKWTDDWVPHCVLEPFLFACTGDAEGLALKPLADTSG